MAAGASKEKRVKRSKSIRLVLLGTVGMTALAGCGTSEGEAAATIFQNEAQCAQQNDPAACRTAFADAQAAHAATAPAFTSQAACEEKFGAENCAAVETTPNAQQLAEGEGTQASASPGMGYFMPMLLGYTMGSMMSGRRMAQPVWRDSKNTAFVGGRAAGTIEPGSLGKAAPARVTRGGFGTSAFGSSTS
jgi:uncharacterized protein YgiB involved in biofilm formation